MMVNTARAAWKAARHQNGIFERTPKFGIENKGQKWQTRRYQLRVDPIVWAEIALAFLNGWTIWRAISLGNYAIAIYSALFCLGMLFASGLTLYQGISVSLQKSRADSSSRPG